MRPSLAWIKNCPTKSAGIANPIPFEPPDLDNIDVFTPTKAPEMSINAPPELPGLIGASVCKKYPLADPEAMPVLANPEIIDRFKAYQPVERGFERELKKRISYFNNLREKRKSV